MPFTGLFAGETSRISPFAFVGIAAAKVSVLRLVIMTMNGVTDGR